MSDVRVGQVWASKNTGKWAKVYGEDDHGWMMEWDRWGTDNSKRFAISEAWLMDDYVLVKDAEEAK